MDCGCKLWLKMFTMLSDSRCLVKTYFIGETSGNHVNSKQKIAHTFIIKNDMMAQTRQTS